MKSKQRWIEIRFIYLCFSLYNNIRDYIIVTNYLTFLSEIANVDKLTTLRLLQRVNQMNAIKPSNAEYAIVAKQNKQTISQIIRTLKISKTTYITITKNADLTIEIKAFSSEYEIEIMKKILDAHEKFKGAGI